MKYDYPLMKSFQENKNQKKIVTAQSGANMNPEMLKAKVNVFSIICPQVMVKLCIVKLLEVYQINEKEKKTGMRESRKKDENINLRSKKNEHIGNKSI